MKDVALQNKVFEGSRQTGIVSSQEDFSRSLSELGAAFRMKLGVKAGFVFVLARLGPAFCGVCAPVLLGVLLNERKFDRLLCAARVRALGSYVEVRNVSIPNWVHFLISKNENSETQKTRQFN